MFLNSHILVKLTQISIGRGSLHLDHIRELGSLLLGTQAEMHPFPQHRALGVQGDGGRAGPAGRPPSPALQLQVLCPWLNANLPSFRFLIWKVGTIPTAGSL